MSPTSSGIAPVSELLFSHRSHKVRSRPISGGMVPTKPLFSSLIRWTVPPLSHIPCQLAMLGSDSQPVEFRQPRPLVE